uniref:C-mannosyltransferase DPY19L3 n=1 Tax=Denticeps clupeoides TaxID=299321 RepID=A0AAY4EQR5_9TELE
MEVRRRAKAWPECRRKAVCRELSPGRDGTAEYMLEDRGQFWIDLRLGFRALWVQPVVITTGLTLAVTLGIFHAWCANVIHENLLWFSNLKEVEREISFRTECGLYYSYYKQMLKAPSIQQGLIELVSDNLTESRRTINLLQRMNIYQEVFLSVLYRVLPIQEYLEPVYFYIYTVFALQAVYVIALFITSWLLSGSWLAGALTGVWYILNRVDTTRVEFTVSLRENWSLPFFALQVAAITCYLRPQLKPIHQRVVLWLIFLSTFCFCLMWQFNQFILFVQALVIFALDGLDLITHKQKVLWLQSDEHIFKFIKAKFGLGATRDFDASLYLCEEAFGLLPLDTFERLAGTLLLYPYVSALGVLLLLLALVSLGNLSSEEVTIRLRPDVAYNLLHTICFGLLALSTMRMKYLWTGHMCAFAAYGVCGREVWELCLKVLRLIRYTVPIVILAFLYYKFWPKLTEEISELREFYDPDTVELMTWISAKTPKSAVFAGSMQLLAGIKLCTGRVLTNHPHYEDKALRERTRQVYQIYARQSPEEVHRILRAAGADYVVLEDSICYERRHRRGCRLRDLLDLANGHVGKEATATFSLISHRMAHASV